MIDATPIFGREEIIAIGRKGMQREIAVQHYPDWMPRVEQLTDCKTLLVRPNSLDTFMTAMFYADALAARCIPAPVLLLPCVPGARQDRVGHTGDFLFTAWSIAREINLRQFPQVVIVDPHSDVIAACIDRCEVLPAGYGFNAAEIGVVYDGVIAPDAGGEKRAAHIASLIGVPVVHGGKRRDVATGAISEFWLHDAEPGHYLVVDDLCDAGGTFLGLHDKITDAGATADLYVTHGLFTRGTQSLCEAYGTVYCTDSTVSEKPDVSVIPLCNALLEDYA
jgi:ribose-phosphate pyrophosphokinase